MQRVELRSPPVERLVPTSLDGGAARQGKGRWIVSTRGRASLLNTREANVLPVQLEASGDLVDAARDLFVEDERDNNLLDFCVRNAELLQAKAILESCALKRQGRAGKRTRARYAISSRVYGLMISRIHCVRSERRTSSM